LAASPVSKTGATGSMPDRSTTKMDKKIISESFTYCFNDMNSYAEESLLIKEKILKEVDNMDKYGYSFMGIMKKNSMAGSNMEITIQFGMPIREVLFEKHNVYNPPRGISDCLNAIF
jgi:hypothetical protein